MVRVFGALREFAPDIDSPERADTVGSWTNVSTIGGGFHDVVAHPLVDRDTESSEKWLRQIAIASRAVHHVGPQIRGTHLSLTSKWRKMASQTTATHSGESHV